MMEVYNEEEEGEEEEGGGLLVRASNLKLNEWSLGGHLKPLGPSAAVSSSSSLWLWLLLWWVFGRSSSPLCTEQAEEEDDESAAAAGEEEEEDEGLGSWRNKSPEAKRRSFHLLTSVSAKTKARPFLLVDLRTIFLSCWVVVVMLSAQRDRREVGSGERRRRWWRC